MEKYSVHFEVTQVRETEVGMGVPVNYDFWMPLLSYFINKCTHFRIDCWIDEKEAIERAKVFGEIADNNINNMKVFQGNITDEFTQELIHNPFDKEGKVKWFSVFLKKGEEIIISSEHYGSEFASGLLTQEDIEYIQSIIPKDFDFCVYNME